MKRAGFSLIALLLAIPAALADPITDTINSAFKSILSKAGPITDVATLGSLTRILIGVLVFAIFYAVATGLNKGPFKFLGKNQALIVALVLAIISAIFIPPNLLLAIGGAYATIIAFILIGGPVVGLAYIVLTIPGKDDNGKSLETRGSVLVKLVLSLLMFWVLSAVQTTLAKGSTGATTSAAAGSMDLFVGWALTITTLMIIWYIIKFFLVGDLSKEEQEAELSGRRKAVSDWIGKKGAEKKAKAKSAANAEEKKSRKRRISPIRKNVIDAINAAEDIPALLRSRNRKVILHRIKIVKNNLEGAIGNLRLLKDKYGAAERADLKKRVDEINATLNLFLSEVKGKLPKKVGSTWNSRTNPISTEVTNIAGSLGNVLNKIEEFYR